MRQNPSLSSIKFYLKLILKILLQSLGNGSILGEAFEHIMSSEHTYRSGSSKLVIFDIFLRQNI